MTLQKGRKWRRDWKLAKGISIAAQLHISMQWYAAVNLLVFYPHMAVCAAWDIPFSSQLIVYFESFILTALLWCVTMCYMHQRVELQGDLLRFHRGHAGERLWLETPLKRTRDGRGNSRWHWWIEWCGGLARAHIKAVGCIGVESWVTGNRAAGRWITEGKTKQGWFSWRYAQRTARENSQSDEH